MVVDFMDIDADCRCSVFVGSEQEHGRCYNVPKANAWSVWLEYQKHWLLVYHTVMFLF